MRILELGPLEGCHTYMLDRFGAAEVTAVEGNRDAFLRCLIVKELLGIPAARFLCGDFVSYLEQAVHRRERWDLCLAVGVLYHQQDPVHLLELVSHVADRLMIWTHYYDAQIISKLEGLGERFGAAEEVTVAGYTHTLHRYNYGTDLGWGGFCGGTQPTTAWMSKPDILGALDHLGFSVVGISLENTDHHHGPALSLTAERRRENRTAV
jgi:hypothetical protein